MPTNKQRDKLDSITIQIAKVVGKRYKDLGKGVKLDDAMLKMVKMNRVDMDTIYKAQRGFELSSKVLNNRTRTATIVDV